MLPKDILRLIDDYNEPGVFVISITYKIYWFNGKRFRYWCDFNFGTILTYQNDLYAMHYYTGLCIYKNNSFQQIIHKKGWNELKIFANDKSYLQVLVGKFIYEIGYYPTIVDLSFTKFDGINRINLPKKPHFSVFKMIPYKNEIFAFGQTHNEKFDLINNCWFPFATTPYINYCHVYLFKDRFYAIKDIDSYVVYNPVTNCWEYISFIR